MPERPRIIIFHKSLGQKLASAAGGDFDVVAPEPNEDRTEWLTRHGRGIRVLVIIGSDMIDAPVLELMPDLEHIQVSGAGMDKVALDEVARRGIRIENAGMVHAGEVADFAMALMLAARRNLIIADHWVRRGRWEEKPMRPSRSLNGAKVGIVGLGHIGTAFARRVEPFETEVAWWGPRPKPDVRWPRHGSLLELAHWADILLVAIHACDATRGIIDRRIIEAVGRDGLIVNVARGFVIDEDGMIAALKDGRLGQAALDVFETEPTPAERWRGLPNVVLAPHAAGATAGTIERLVHHTVSRVRVALGIA